MLSLIFSLLILLNLIDLQSLVLSLDGMDRHESFVLDNIIPGVRVASFALGECVSPIYTHDILLISGETPRGMGNSWLRPRLVSESVQPIKTIVYSNMFSILGYWTRYE